MNILVVNQHTNNRGDESAARAMVYGLRNVFDNPKIEIMKQDEKNPFLNIKSVNEIGMVNSIGDILKFLFGFFSRFLKLEKVSLFRKLYGDKFKKYLDADLIISAPGGPYLGDLYIDHEIVHLAHIFFGVMLKKPVIIYAVSMGPFNNIFSNIIRRLVLSRIDLIILRDPVSKTHVKKLLPHKKIFITADSCMQQPIKSLKCDGFTAGITLWGFQTRRKSMEKLKKYIKTMSSFCDSLVDEYGARIVFLPQLFGKYSDVQLIKSVQCKMKHRSQIIGSNKNSIYQQKIVSSLRILVGARYHSIIFSAKMNVPFVPIYYEHKTVGFVEMLELEDFLIDIDKLSLDLLKRKTKKIIDNEKLIRKILCKKMPFIQKRSFFTSKIVKDYFVFCSVKNKYLTKENIYSYLERKYKGDNIFKLIKIE